jgi:hypothetical protein
MKTMDYKLAVIEWVDSQSIGSGWIHIDDLPKPELCLCKSVGWVYKEDEDIIMVCPNFSFLQDLDDLGFHSPFVIPKCSIKKIIYLNEDEQK